MVGPEQAPKSRVGVEVQRTPEHMRVTGETYTLLFSPDSPYVKLRDTVGHEWTDLSMISRLDTDRASDETVGWEEPTIVQTEEGLTIRIDQHSTAWDRKVQVWQCRPDTIEIFHEVAGEGALLDYEMLSGQLLNRKGGTYPSRKYFDTVFNPEPTSSETIQKSADEPVHIDVNGTLRPGHIDWFSTPSPWCYGASKKDSNKWLMTGVAASVEEQNFLSFSYRPYEDSYSYTLDFQAHTRVDGFYRTPSLLLQFADDPYEGLQKYTEQLGKRRLLPMNHSRPTADWWNNPMFCGWGEQVELSKLTPETKPQDLATEEFYNRCLGILANHDLVPPTVTIDDKWQLTHGRNEVDPAKWSDLPAWIDDLHSRQQKVLLWRTVFSTEGVDPDLCILDPDGNPISIDPNNPEWIQMARQDVHRMLGRNGYDADGFKIDFTADVPNGRYLTSKGPRWGAALLHSALKTIYRAAKEAKPDALIVTHTHNPQFTDVADMFRLNDINFKEPVLPQMRHRAAVIKAVAPSMLIDTDDWMMPDIETWRQYAAAKSDLGIFALYHVSHVAGTPMREKDYRLLRMHSGFQRSLDISTERRAI